MERVLSSPAKQRALVRLMSSEPSLMSGLDDALLASITLQPPKTPRWGRDGAVNEVAPGRAARRTLLYAENAGTESAAAISSSKREELRAATVLLSPSSNAAAVAATASSKQDGRAAASRPYIRSTRKNVVSSISPVVLLDDGALEQVTRATPRSVRKKSKTSKRRGRKKSNGSSSGDEVPQSHTSDSNQGPQIANSNGGARSLKTRTDFSARILLDHHHFVSRDKWIPRRARKSCYVCLRDFNILRKRHSCRMCGEVICSRCSVFREVNLPVMENKLRICSSCFVSYRKKAEEAEQSAAADDNESNASESLTTPKHEEHTSDTNSQSSQSLEADDAIPILQAAPSDNNSDNSSLRNTINTMSEFSFSSDSTLDMANYLSRSTEEELEAVLKAKQLEKEVEASQQRIQALETQIALQESHQDLLSAEQQTQLQDAREMIKLLQEKLRLQELSAKQAAYNRDSICLSKLRQTELYVSADDESVALKKKLKVLERQLKQAGISVAEVIPYEVAKQKVEELSRRLQELGSSEVVMENKQAQAAARKEYYILEQQMEKYHTALVMTDEYIEEQRHQEMEWEAANELANVDAVRLLRSAIPVNISRLSEKDLVALTTPTGTAFPAELARRLKRTNILQLLRTNPKNIVKMHPSVIEGYRTTGLTLLERRALHHALREPFQEWRKQQKDDLAQKKYAWYCTLKDAFVTAASNYQSHCEASKTSIDDEEIERHSCGLVGLACPVRAEERVRKLYTGLGFPAEPEFLEEDILKSDPEGAGEKALLEAQAHAREVVANQRQRELKAHYKMNMRAAAQATGALEEMDAILERVCELDEAFSCILPTGAHDIHEHKHLSQCTALLSCIRELALLLAKRAGICLTGKRDEAKDEGDTRSPLEIKEATFALDYLQQILADIKALLFDNARGSQFAMALGTYQAIQELLVDVRQKNKKAGHRAPALALGSRAAGIKARVRWQDRQLAGNSTAASAQVSSSDSTCQNSKPARGNSATPPVPSYLTRSRPDESNPTDVHL